MKKMSKKELESRVLYNALLLNILKDTHKTLYEMYSISGYVGFRDIMDDLHKVIIRRNDINDDYIEVLLDEKK